VVAAFLPPDAGLASCEASRRLHATMQTAAKSGVSSDNDLTFLAVVSEEAADDYNIAQWPTLIFFRGNRRELYRGPTGSAMDLIRAVRWRLRPTHEEIVGDATAMFAATRRALASGSRAVVVQRAGPSSAASAGSLAAVAGKYIDAHCGLRYLTWVPPGAPVGPGGDTAAAGQEYSDQEDYSRLVITTCVEPADLHACWRHSGGSESSWLRAETLQDWQVLKVPDCCWGGRDTAISDAWTLQQWITSHSLPVLAELHSANSADVVGRGYPVVILYLPVESTEAACAEAEDVSECEVMHSASVAARHGQPLARASIFSRAYSFGDPEECDDCRELVELGVETDCSTTCERQVNAHVLARND